VGGWVGSTRKGRLPADWRTRRAHVLSRDHHLCQWVRVDTGGLCGMLATDVDHINPGDDHSTTNLQSLCRYHHARKSASEGATAANKLRPTRERDTTSLGSMRKAMLDRTINDDDR
jgi:5-methylcytosine-specific restriction endonuclease McrA